MGSSLRLAEREREVRVTAQYGASMVHGCSGLSDLDFNLTWYLIGFRARARGDVTCVGRKLAVSEGDRVDFSWRHKSCGP